MTMTFVEWTRTATSLSAVAMIGAMIGACGGDDGRDPFASGPSSVTLGPGTSPSTDPTMGGGETMGDDETAEGGGGPKLDIGSDESGGVDTGNECAAISDTADVGIQPADILVVVDNSGSMSMEAAFVQANMNAFSSQIFLANIDAHVALISANSSDDAGICLPQPIGSGSCPADDNPPSYLHIADGVGSSNALEKILQHYDQWSTIFRPTAAKHVIVVTDDDSSISANDFDTMFRALDPTLEDYTFHAIAAPEDPNPFECLVVMTTCCGPGGIPLSADVGQVYIDLASLTGGVFGNLCEQNFGPVFDQVSMQVVSGATLACEYDIPPPPDGEEFNPAQVNVEFEDGMGTTLPIGNVPGLADCAGVSDGWYYDDPLMPTKIVVCPQTCDQIQGLNNASVSIQFGCATIPAG